MTKKLLKISKYRPSIFQGRFDFAGASGLISLAHEHPLETLIRRILCALLIALGCGYLYFVTTSVMNVIVRTEAISSIAAVQGQIGSLEQKYFELSHAVTPERAAELGLLPVPGTQYVYRPGTVGAASAATMGRNEI